MTQNAIDYMADMFRRQCSGNKLLPTERAFLQGLLDRMAAPERAGSIAAIIQIMLDGTSPFNGVKP
jgi:hypothetical protein